MVPHAERPDAYVANAKLGEFSRLNMQLLVDQGIGDVALEGSAPKLHIPTMFCSERIAKYS